MIQKASGATEASIIGQTVQKYRIDRVLATGGMGVIYEAKHLHLDLRAAVKTIIPAFSSIPQYRERFFREARACSQLATDASLVRILDFGELPDGTLYMLMELLNGESVAARLEREPNGCLRQDAALHFAHQVAAAMVKAHQLGIVHRDLKPANLFIVPDAAASLGERVKVLDFGIAKFVDSSNQPPLTVQGQIGTTRYMAPECFANQDSHSAVGPPADVYALGCILYELLCGRAPFLNDDPRCLAQMHRGDTPRALREREPKVSPAVDVLVRRMLSKQPDRRPNMVRIVNEIGHILLSNHQPSLPQRLLSGDKRSRPRTTEARGKIARFPSKRPGFEPPTRVRPHARTDPEELPASQASVISSALSTQPFGQQSNTRVKRLLSVASVAGLMFFAGTAIVWRSRPRTPGSTKQAVSPTLAVDRKRVESNKLEPTITSATAALDARSTSAVANKRSQTKESPPWIKRHKESEEQSGRQRRRPSDGQLTMTHAWAADANSSEMPTQGSPSSVAPMPPESPLAEPSPPHPTDPAPAEEALITWED